MRHKGVPPAANWLEGAPGRRENVWEAPQAHLQRLRVHCCYWLLSAGGDCCGAALGLGTGLGSRRRLGAAALLLLAGGEGHAPHIGKLHRAGAAAAGRAGRGQGTRRSGSRTFAPLGCRAGAPMPHTAGQHIASTAGAHQRAATMGAARSPLSCHSAPRYITSAAPMAAAKRAATWRRHTRGGRRGGQRGGEIKAGGGGAAGQRVRPRSQGQEKAWKTQAPPGSGSGR